MTFENLEIGSHYIPIDDDNYIGIKINNKRKHYNAIRIDITNGAKWRIKESFDREVKERTAISSAEILTKEFKKIPYSTNFLALRNGAYFYERQNDNILYDTVYIKVDRFVALAFFNDTIWPVAVVVNEGVSVKEITLEEFINFLSKTKEEKS